MILFLNLIIILRQVSCKVTKWGNLSLYHLVNVGSTLKDFVFEFLWSESKGIFILVYSCNWSSQI